MKYKKNIIITLIVLAAIALIAFLSIKHVKHNTNIMLNSIDSLNVVNDSLETTADSLMVLVDSLQNRSARVDSVIIKVNKVYEKNLVDIINQPISSDAKFFANYLSEDSTRLINSNNTSAVKTN